MASITIQHIRTHGYSDAKTFKAEFGLAQLRSLALREAQRRFLTENNPTANGHTLEALQKMRENRKGKGVGVSGKYERTPEIRQKISEGVVRQFHENPMSWKGQWVQSEKADKRVWVRSSWEARVLRLLDACPDVEEVYVEPFAIPYFLDGRKHKYIPDFLVVSEGGVEDVWEIKPKEFLDAPKNAAKWDALKKYAAERSNGRPLNVRLVTLEDIEKMERSLGLGPENFLVVKARRI